MKIRADELEKLDTRNCFIIDLRDPSAFEYGHIKGAVNITPEQLDSAELPADKQIIIYCKAGIISGSIADDLCDRGFNAWELEGGYAEWLRFKMENRMITEQVELSLRKKFKKSIWCKFTKAIN